MRHRHSISAAVATAIATLGLAPLAPAATTTVSCGQTLTHSVRLANDLSDCPGDGVVIGADDITVDLNGHTIDGQSTQLTDCNNAPFGSSAINNDAGHDGVTVKDGTVQEFDNGLAGGFGRSVISRVTVRAIRFAGIVISSSDPEDNIANNRIEHDHLAANCQSAILVFGENNRIADNRLADNGAGIVVLVTSGAEIHDNSVTRSAGPAVLLFRANNTTISGNSASHNGDGISLNESSANQVKHNTVTDSGSGVELFASGDNRIENNSVTDNSDTGVLLDGGADNNRIEHNVASGNGFAGIATGASNGNLIADNTTSGNPGAGIAVGNNAQDNAQGTIVARNTASDNGSNPPGCRPECPLLDDGIHIESPGTTVTANTADRNHDLGIDAVTGVTDGGRNNALGNGNPLQCTAVICSLTSSRMRDDSA